MKRKTARERAARAYMPIMLIAKEAVITIIEVEIQSAISDALEEAAKIADWWIEQSQQHIDLLTCIAAQKQEHCHQFNEARSIADAIRALKEKE